MPITFIPIGRHALHVETNSGIANPTASNLLYLVRTNCSTLRCLATCASASEAERLLSLSLSRVDINYICCRTILDFDAQDRAATVTPHT